MKLKPIMTWSASDRKLRLLRLIWERGTVGDGKGYSAFFSLALMPRLFLIERTLFKFRVVILGISLHWRRSYGGRFV